jgi:hypothetical protein
MEVCVQASNRDLTPRVRDQIGDENSTRGDQEDGVSEDALGEPDHGEEAEDE